MIKNIFSISLIIFLVLAIISAQELTQEEEKSLGKLGLELLDKTNLEESDGYIELIDGREYYVDIKTGEKTLILTTKEANEKNSTGSFLKKIIIFLLMLAFVVALAIIIRITFILFRKKKRKKKNIRKQTMFSNKPLGKVLIKQKKI